MKLNNTSAVHKIASSIPRSPTSLKEQRKEKEREKAREREIERQRESEREKTQQQNIRVCTYS